MRGVLHVVFNFCRQVVNKVVSLFEKSPWYLRVLIVCFGGLLFCGLSLLPYVVLFGLSTVVGVFQSDLTQLNILLQPLYSMIFALGCSWFLHKLLSVQSLSRIETKHLGLYQDGGVAEISSERLFGLLSLGALVVALFTCFSDYVLGASVYAQVDSWGYIFALFPGTVLSTCFNAVLILYLYRVVRVAVLWVVSKCSWGTISDKVALGLSWFCLVFFVVFWASYSMFSFYASFESNLTVAFIPYLVSNFLMVPLLWGMVCRVRSSVRWVVCVSGLYSVFYFVFAVICTMIIHGLTVV